MTDRANTALDQVSGREDSVDALLAARVARGEPAAFDELVVAQQDRISRLVYRLLAWSNEAEDVTQEVFLAALKNMKKFRGQSRLSTWLTQIAVNKCRSHRRKLRVRLGFLVNPAKLAKRQSEPPPQTALMDRETFGRVRQAVWTLPWRYREVVVLRYLEQVPTVEVARVLGITRAAVETRLHRARARLKEVLAELVAE